MWRCRWLLIARLGVILPAHADADMACVSNEKSKITNIFRNGKP